MLRRFVCLALALTAAAATDAPVEIDNVPFQVSRCLQGFQGKYRINRWMNPFYLRGDFDGDKQADYVALIEEVATKKQGFLFCFGDAQRKPQILGAGVSIPVEGGLPADDWATINVWGVAPGCGGGKLECLFIEKAYAGSGWFIWNGRQFTWRQGGI